MSAFTLEQLCYIEAALAARKQTLVLRDDRDEMLDGILFVLRGQIAAARKAGDVIKALQTCW